MTASAEAQIDTAGMNESVASTAAPPQPEDQTTVARATVQKKRRVDAVKLEKQVATLQGKIAKLLAENKDLKQQQKTLRSSMSRIHRIPKKQT